MAQADASSQLPNGPTEIRDLVDRGDYLVLTGIQTPSSLIDAETGGMLTLPIVGPAAAAGEWGESPRWAIPGAVAEDVTDEIRALEPTVGDCSRARRSSRRAPAG